ncbi:hypothetical protein [Stenotrophomonas sp.]|uniref:hypothetical protein n=1 Tax=Stenotrophomonas sp. TaxID=69392 RepID=UPI00289DA41F|nr:hypothetical protein [Stenotrophomonas sp.]
MTALPTSGRRARLGGGTGCVNLLVNKSGHLLFATVDNPRPNASDAKANAERAKRDDYERVIHSAFPLPQAPKEPASGLGESGGGCYLLGNRWGCKLMGNVNVNK